MRSYQAQYLINFKFFGSLPGVQFLSMAMLFSSLRLTRRVIRSDYWQMLVGGALEKTPLLADSVSLDATASGLSEGTNVLGESYG